MSSFRFSSSELEGELSSFAARGITEFTLQDPEILSSKVELLRFLRLFQERAGDVFLTLPVSADVLDMDVCGACSNLFCSLEIPLEGTGRGGAYLLDKKFFSNRARTLNTLGLLFGFDMTFAAIPGDSVKAFRDRIDFAVSLYPNHIDFPQLEPAAGKNPGLHIKMPRPTATFSTQDIKAAKDCAHAVSTFYSYGRAVTWFLAVLAPLRMSAAKFFQDFAEWQNLSSCSLSSRWSPAEAGHSEIEKMQLSFLRFKYEEKNKPQLFDVVSNVVRLNGAISRCVGESEESVVELSYNPDELLSGAAMDIPSFFENSFIENSSVRVFMGEEGVRWRYC